MYISVVGCCDEESPRIQSHWLRAAEGYVQDPIGLSRLRVDLFKRQYGIVYIEDLGLSGTSGSRTFSRYVHAPSGRADRKEESSGFHDLVPAT